MVSLLLRSETISSKNVPKSIQNLVEAGNIDVSAVDIKIKFVTVTNYTLTAD